MEGILGLVIGKIGSALAAEAAKRTCSFLWSEGLLLAGINGSMRRVERVFKLIKASLGEVDTRTNSKKLEAWIKEVRKIAYDMEDVIDEYTYLITRDSKYKFIGISCSAMKKATNLSAWHQIATQLKQIEEDTKHVFETMKQIFDIKIPDNREGSSATPATPSDYVLEDDPIIIGMVKEKETLIGWMRDEAARENFIITVWGMGGSGKTTLVNSALKNAEIQRHFDLTGLVSVSQSFQPVDLLRRIYKSLTRGKGEGQHEIEGMNFLSLVEKTRAFLCDRRFLVVLDDVWNPKAYNQLKDAFRGHKLGSKIVISTRIKEVANLANKQRRMEHRTLRPDESWDLFRGKAFWQNADRRCPPEAEEWGRKIVDKCGGLPLAIVAIASVLSLKETSDWKGIYDRLNWEFTCNSDLEPSVKHILNLSYYDLPSSLKNCFLYCSIFPEDYEIKRSNLIKLWVAEGFVDTRGAQTMEDVAEDYLNELVHRCMLQAVDRNILGKVKTCRMHDLIREVTLTIAKDENFSTVVTDSQTSSSSKVVNEARRLSIHSRSIPEESVDLSRVRSLIVFESVELPMSTLSSKTSRFLRVLHLGGANINDLPDAVGDLFNLHYLNLRLTKIKQLPNSIGKLHNLQTLDLRETELRSLPRETTKLKNLQSLYISNSSGHMHLNAPKGLWNLTRLQRLEICAGEELVMQLGNLTQLRKLTITSVKGSYCPHLISSLSKMILLNKLSISSSYDGIELVQLKELGDVLKNLMRLDLNSRLSDADLSSLVNSLGEGIPDLFLRNSGLRDDPLTQLSRLSNLIRLVLSSAYEGERLCFCSRWFPKLKILELWNMPSLTRIKFEKESLGSLQILELHCLPLIKQVPQGIEFQQSIKRLQAWYCHQLLGEMMRRKQDCRISRIPSVRIVERRDGEWVDEVIN